MIIDRANAVWLMSINADAVANTPCDVSLKVKMHHMTMSKTEDEFDQSWRKSMADRVDEGY